MMAARWPVVSEPTNSQCLGSDSDSAEPPQAQSAWSATGARLLPCPLAHGHLDLTAALKILAAQGITRILSEGGGTVAAALIAAGLVDDLIHLTAGRLIGADGTAALGPLALPRLADAPAFRLIAQQALGPDTLTQWSRP